MTSLNPTSSPQQSGSINIFQGYAVNSQSPFNLEKLSDKFRHRPSDWTIPEAYIGILMAAAMADGQYSEIEHATIINQVNRSRALRTLPSEVLQAAETNVKRRSVERPSTWFKEACDTLPADMCLPVLAHCIDIILSDGELLPAEGKFLDELAPALDVPPEHAKRVMEVLLLKAQY